MPEVTAMTSTFRSKLPEKSQEEDLKLNSPNADNLATPTLGSKYSFLVNVISYIYI